MLVGGGCFESRSYQIVLVGLVLDQADLIFTEIRLPLYPKEAGSNANEGMGVLAR